MKKLTFTCAVFYCTVLHAQVGIGKTNMTNASTLLEFGLEAKGIILPSVDSAPGAVGGTFIVNTVDQAVQYHNGTDWISLTGVEELIANPYVNTQIADLATEHGVIIGAKTSSKPGVLVLESTSKAMILPKISNPHTSFKSPVAGTIAYDTNSDSLAVCDGQNWFFWQ